MIPFFAVWIFGLEKNLETFKDEFFCLNFPCYTTFCTHTHRQIAKSNQVKYKRLTPPSPKLTINENTNTHQHQVTNMAIRSHKKPPPKETNTYSTKTKKDAETERRRRIKK